MKERDKKYFISCLLFLFVIVLFSQNVLAGPYGYGDSMDLKYSSDGETITYWYGDGQKYTRALKLWKEVEEKSVFEEKVKKEVKIDTTHPRHLKILNEFNKTDWVSIGIEVFSKEMREEVIFTLSETEIRDLRRELMETVFTGEVTKQGLDKLVNNTNIRTMNLQESSSPALVRSVPLINVKTNVWDLGYSGKDQTVCVIDSGVNASHPYIQGKIIAEKCYCRNYEGANPGCCPGGTAEDDDAEDYTGHGTHVIGIIASQDSIYTGVAPNASIAIVKVCNSSTGPLAKACNNYDIAAGITWCKNNKDLYNISVITISLSEGAYAPGFCTPDYADSAINLAVAENIFVDVASGNEGSSSGIGYPACSPNAVSVGASTNSDTILGMTNRVGGLLDLLAPGNGIISLDYDDEYIAVKSGTSMAAPHVAGAAALLLEKDPDLTPDQIKTALKNTSVKIWDQLSQQEYPRIDVLSALNSLCEWTPGSCGGGNCSGSGFQREHTSDNC